MIGAIPARYASTRLPGKPLLEIAGRPMIRHVVERATRADGLDRVVVLTDDERIAEAVTAFGGEVEMTPADCASGTDRIAWAARRWDASTARAVINVQGDEPLIDPRGIGAVASHLSERPEDRMVTLAAPIELDEAARPDRVKVVVDGRGYALYFSRHPIPFRRGDGGPPSLGHIGLYGYRRDALLELAGHPPSPLERAESLEQLRALENGIPIRVLEVERGWPGVDTAEDLARAAALLAEGR